MATKKSNRSETPKKTKLSPPFQPFRLHPNLTRFLTQKVREAPQGLSRFGDRWYYGRITQMRATDIGVIQDLIVILARHGCGLDEVNYTGQEDVPIYELRAYGNRDDDIWALQQLSALYDHLTHTYPDRVAKYTEYLESINAEIDKHQFQEVAA